MSGAYSFEAVSGLRFFKHLFDLTDFLLDLPRYLFADALAFQVGVIRQLAHLFLYSSLHFVNSACNFILGTWHHPCSFFPKLKTASFCRSSLWRISGQNSRTMLLMLAASSCAR